MAETSDTPKTSAAQQTPDTGQRPDARLAPDTEHRPWWLRSNYAPVAEEIDSHDLPSHGTIPDDLNGLLVRNGPNPDRTPVSHWFLGQGMLHGIRLIDGKAQWYRNRRVPEDAAGAGGHLGASSANTHVVSHGGRILALEDTHLPHAVTSDLESLGPMNFNGKLRGPLCAHPKVCPLTGEMHAFGTSPRSRPHLTYYQFSPEGDLQLEHPIEMPVPTMMHDFAITADHVVFMDLPIVFDPAIGLPAYRWDHDHQARLGVLPRSPESGQAPEWFNIEPGYIFHTINACEIGDRIILDTCHYTTLWQTNADSFDSPAMVRRYDIHRTHNFVREETMFDIRCEYPRIDERRTGMPNRYAYVATMAEERQSTVGFGHRIVKLDMAQRASVHHHFGPQRYVGEPVFVPRDAVAGDEAASSSEEDDGYVLTIVYNREDKTSTLVILSASNIAEDPLAAIHLPQRIPYGFHGTWIPSQELVSIS